MAKPPDEVKTFSDFRQWVIERFENSMTDDLMYIIADVDYEGPELRPLFKIYEQTEKNIKGGNLDEVYVDICDMIRAELKTLQKKIDILNALNNNF